MTNTDITVSRTSRFKDTVPFLSEAGIEFGLWEPPIEFHEKATGYRLHQIAAREIGFIDEIAVLYYGDGNENLWWAIAQANGIIDPDRDMKVGGILVIPPRVQLMEFIARAGNASIS